MPFSGDPGCGGCQPTIAAFSSVSFQPTRGTPSRQPVVVVVNIINHKHLRFPKYAVHWVLRQAYKLS